MAPSMTLPLGLGIFGDVVFTHAAIVRPARNLAALIAVLQHAVSQVSRSVQAIGPFVDHFFGRT